MIRTMRSALLCGIPAVWLAACGGQPVNEAPAAEPAARAETADEFVARINREMADLAREANAAGWTQATYITPDTELLNARASARYLEYFTRAVGQSRRYEGEAAGRVSADARRAMMLLKLDVSAPAPDDPARRTELTELAARLDAMYGEGSYCPKRQGAKTQAATHCPGVDELGEILAKSRDYDQLLDVWTGWHHVGVQMRKPYERFVALANEGARELGFRDLGELWRAGYDMTPAEFESETARLYSQVEPLYRELHCYARSRLAKVYGENRVPAGRPIPAHLFGNMWAQQWNRIYDDVLKPYPQASIESADRLLKAKKWDALRMTKSAEHFYMSIGFPALPPKFWERSMLTRPRDREVVCHASAWDMDSAREDVRIKMCMRPTEEDLFTIYHELGHVYYFLWYRDLPYLFRGGANDGFHEAVGDTVNLSVTPGYLSEIGLVSAVKPGREAVINQQMKMASEKIAFLPFGKLIDEWRWRVFSGEITPANYNAAWWQLREKYQGVAPPVPRSEADFDPGAKYHIPANTPYTRYFLAFILQFQFQQALCKAAGFEGPLHECSIFGSKAAGERFAKVLSQGASQPWQDTLEQLTGTRQMDASALIEYFQPLSAWLKEQNAGQKCGW
ncbi:MAG: M2 family metallopeptidase [Gammaproteobacteria bacterium]|nr:M2 family metallopeptidase [Gammaproteobacteria bacterium]